MRIVVIGSGFGGLGVAIRLRALGHDVTIVEKQEQPGGVAQVYHHRGFTFDAGPSFITAPWLIQELFDAAGKRTADYISLVPLEPFYTIRFEDGSIFRYSGLGERFAREIRRFDSSDVQGYIRLRNATGEMFASSFPLTERPLTSVGDAARVLPELLRPRAYRSVAAFVNECIRDDRLRRVFSAHTLFIGGDPFRTPALYAMLQTLEQRWGVWFAMGGTGAIVRALVRLFTEQGGTLRLGAAAAAIDVDARSRRATGVRLASGEVLGADAIVSNADVAFTYLQLVPAGRRTVETDRRIAGRTYSTSLFILCFGTDRRYDDLAHHELLMGRRDQLLRQGVSATSQRHPHDFSLYLHRPTATDRSLAPDGCDSWYVMSAVPNLHAGTDWAVAAGPYRDAIVQYLEQRYLPGLSQHIVAERCIDPRWFRDELNCHLGSAFSVEPTRTQTGCFRPHNQSPDIQNLFFVGAGTHPGAGLPGVLSSSKIAAQLIGGA
jgi:phytoene desaturase